jgi:hypothetical protein
LDLGAPFADAALADVTSWAAVLVSPAEVLLAMMMKSWAAVLVSPAELLLAMMMKSWAAVLVSPAELLLAVTMACCAAVLCSKVLYIYILLQFAPHLFANIWLSG